MRKIITIFICFVAFFESNAQVLDTLVDVGGYKLHFNIIKGNGTPILFEAGNGDDASVWQSITTEIHKQTNATIITYDRAGLGKSEIDTAKISFQNEIKNLKIALKKLGYSKELTIVCHSFGGYYASFFTYQNPKKVKGIVCIDIATPCFFTKEWSENFIKTIKKEDWQMIRQYKIGLFYILSNFTSIAEFMQNKFLSSKTPVTMIMAENIQSMIKEEEKEKWINCCKEFGTLPNHNFIVAKNCGHKVWKDNPELVISEITKLYKKVNKK